MISRIGLGHDDGSVTTTRSTFPLFTKALLNLKMCLLLLDVASYRHHQSWWCFALVLLLVVEFSATKMRSANCVIFVRPVNATPPPRMLLLTPQANSRLEHYTSLW